MTTPTKPRAFKLQFDSSADSPKVSVASEEAFIKFNECIEVIEKSAFDKVVAALKDIMDTLHEAVNQDFDELSATCDDINDKLVKTLREIGCEL